MRCFIAIGLPDALKEQVCNVQGRLGKRDLFAGRFVERKNMHMTLKFLGEISADDVERVRERLRRIRLKNFGVRLGRAGVFSKSFVRIVWIEVVGGGLVKLQERIDDALSGLFEKERRFMGHLTIARVRNVMDRERMFEELEKIRFTDGDFHVDRFFLVESVMEKSGVTYKIIDSFFLE